MSEFKFACPVCGQHISADSNDGGSEMECPTCFRKIVVPQPPSSSDPKLILSAAEAGKARPQGARPQWGPIQFAPVRTSISLAVAGALGVAAVMLFAYRDTLFKRKLGPGHTGYAISATSTNPFVALAATNDVAWGSDLSDAVFPDVTAAGKINGEGFVCQKAVLLGGVLMLRQYRDGLREVKVIINLPAEQAEELQGKFVEVLTNTAAPPRVMLRWENNQQSLAETVTNGYALKLSFGDPSKHMLPGKIYLCLPDEEKSRVAGTFNAEMRPGLRTRPR
jgi:hypothetical protein